MQYYILLLSLLFTAISLPATAQGTVERAKQRTERKANNRVDQKIDREVDKAFNAIEGLFKKKKKDESETDTATTAVDSDGEEAANAFINMLTGGDEDFEPFENERPFTLVMTITEEKRNKSEPAVIRLGASVDQIAMITEQTGEGTAQMIFDTQTGKTTMVTTDKKGKTQGYRMRMPNLGKMMDEAAVNVTERYEIERTGERRTIDGYDCELVIVTDTESDAVTRSWITNDLDITSQDVFGSVARMMGGKRPQAGTPQMPVPADFGELIQGFPIESSTVDGNQTTSMRITDIRTGGDIDRSFFDTGDVAIQDMGF